MPFGLSEPATLSVLCFNGALRFGPTFRLCKFCVIKKRANCLIIKIRNGCQSFISSGTMPRPMHQDIVSSLKCTNARSLVEFPAQDEPIHFRIHYTRFDKIDRIYIIDFGSKIKLFFTIISKKTLWCIY